MYDHQGNEGDPLAECNHLPLEPCKFLRPNSLQVFIDGGYCPIKTLSTLTLADVSQRRLTDVLIVLKAGFQSRF